MQLGNKKLKLAPQNINKVNQCRQKTQQTFKNDYSVGKNGKYHLIVITALV